MWKELLVIGVMIFGAKVLFLYEDIAYMQDRTNRDIHHQELVVRKIEAEATLASLRVRELELAQSFTDAWGDTYSTK
ncbi:TMhelix containing protein [Vibrio phage 1.188.A._10N.286.51.A6]|uniref:TMhelix containing protein n=4 Tax=Mukerjeevirus TaxID=2733146 RepID=A0A2I7REG2_9CAUD|nr:TMhelix containing protein [Vibrio phage 1.169.O._10N.261.52.B1]YP_009817472.1 TMhelix containing protein [Vibrio phage 1.188.A._10N.286.51.A6]AUR93667.1 TMhelix containing protein [Vibrio phage 1.188.B._10N.286.51.A6]AUR93753.1 TMhelix containing protein [Vibrio phage 1.188.C._10N.286.51.A6]AUR92048.1 TMhelix containing protein [Vibrio phage 1.169.O._10N.261.52.B1]AUR93581.1 TMhelix containing protein [Vibrio phage 1.188.A._10N.286.51.A6]